MPIIKWCDTYAVGNERMDEEHKRLIEMVNKAFDSQDCQKSILEQLTMDMKEYAIMHFSTEEKYMNDYAYPGTPKHVAEHNQFKALANGDEEPDPIELIRFLADWLNTHISDSDKALGLYLQTKGVY